MGGGGATSESTTGTVVQSTAPWAANLAGQYGYQAAQQASQQATSAINDAISQMNQNYTSAAKGIQPYTQEGVQALNKLNQYLQLNPYNPGTAPKAPTLQNNTPKIDVATGSIIGDKDWNGLAGQAAGIIKQNPGLELSNSQAHNITSMATLLGSKDKLNPSEASFLAKFSAMGGYVGQQGTEFLQGFKQEDPKIAQQKYDDAMGQYNIDKENYDYAKSSYDQYTAEGPKTADQIAADISSQPGYAAQLNQGINAINKSSSAKGYLGSGRVLKELTDYGQNTLSQFYGDTLSRLAGLAGSGQQAATTQAGLSAQKGNSLAGLYTTLGETQANATLAGAGALQNAVTAANQDFRVMQTGSSSSDSGGGGMGGIGQALGGAASLAKVFGFSSKSLKDKVSTPSTKEIMDNVREMSLDVWGYKGIDTNHLGPYAEEFAERFNIGDGKGIHILDAFGVVFGALKELDKKLTAISMENRYAK